MTEVRSLSSNDVVSDGSYRPQHQYGLFATAAYSEGETILTESPLVVLSSASSQDEMRRQFKASSLAPAPTAVKKDETPASLLNVLILPKNVLENDPSIDSCTSKLRGMILALACYAVSPPSESANEKLFELYHPSLENEDDETHGALKTAQVALQCSRAMAAPESALSSLLCKGDSEGGNDVAMKIFLIYSCNSFEGGRLYHRLSRVNHSCNPNAVVVEGGHTNDSNMSVLKAACEIAPGDEITISYLGRYLYAGYPIRQKMLQANKHFTCKCTRCSDNVIRGQSDKKSDKILNHGDLASRVPCPKCHPRTGRYLEEDVMFDEGDGDGLKVCYATPSNGLAAEERDLYCPTCKCTTSISDEGIRKKKEGLAIKYMCMAEDKVLDHLESNRGSEIIKNKKKQNGGSGGDDIDTEREIDQQFLQMATSICGAQHWSTHFLNLSLIEESLASFHSTLMSMGRDPEQASETTEDLFVEIAEAADGIERAYAFASSLELNLDPAHWLFDYTVGLARTLVALGDEKSQKYGATWIEKVDKYASYFENDAMKKVVASLKCAHENRKDISNEIQDIESDCKRRKVG